jgi:hypothetical protein
MRPVLNARFDQLTKPQKDKLREWREQVNSNGYHKGLWIVGARGAGSSYIANVAVRRLVTDNDWGWEWFTAAEIIEATRNCWGYDEQIRQHPYDDGLWEEYRSAEDSIDFFWNKIEIVCVDDLHSNTDVKFWRKHCQESLEQRIKAGRPVVVATDMAPNDPAFTDITRVIENLFVIVHATR